MQNMNILEMLDEAAASEILAMYDNDDIETIHSYADQILTEVLKKLGFDKTVEAFRRLPKWYA